MKGSQAKLKKETRILFSRQLALALNSDISLTEGLNIIRSKAEDPILIKALDQIIAKIYEGYSFGEAIKDQEEVFSSFYVEMIHIGEASGNLTDILEDIATAYERDLQTMKKVKQAVTYPIILSVLMFGVIVLLIVEVMPMFDRVLKSLGGEMPQITKIILGMGLFFKANGLYVLAAIIVLIILLNIYKKTEKGRYFFDKLKFKIPFQKDLTSSVLAARFAGNLGLLMNSGVPVSHALSMIYPVIDNAYMSEALKGSVDEVNQGKPLDEVIGKLNLFPSLLMKLFAVGVATGQMDKALLRAAHEMNRDVDDKLAKLTNVLEPILIIVLSVIVGIILISVVLPVISIMNNIG